jgi:hypothetical protein
MNPFSGRHLRLLAAVIVLPLAFGACATGAGADDGVASLSSPDVAAASATPGASTNPEDAMLEFAQCMRDNGVDMPDPQTGGGGVRIAIGQNGIDPRSEEFQAAQEACQHFLEDAGFGGPRDLSQEQLDQMVEFAQCMRDNGIDMPDPGADGSVSFRVRGQSGNDEQGRAVGPMGIDIGSEEFQAAQEACQDLMPDFGPGSDGGPSTNSESPAP